MASSTIDPMPARIGSELGRQGDARLRASRHNLLVNLDALVEGRELALLPNTVW